MAYSLVLNQRAIKDIQQSILYYAPTGASDPVAPGGAEHAHATHGSAAQPGDMAVPSKEAPSDISRKKDILDRGAME